MSIALFLQLWTTNNWKTLKNQKSQESQKTFIAWLIQNFGLQIRKCL